MIYDRVDSAEHDSMAVAVAVDEIPQVLCFIILYRSLIGDKTVSKNLQ